MGITTHYDDGRGHVLLKIEKSTDCVTMRKKEDFHDVAEAGDYAFETWAESFDFLVLVCPFCGWEAPMPWHITVVEKDPLDILQELSCSKCSTTFFIIKGTAYKCWLPMEGLKKCLTSGMDTKTG